MPTRILATLLSLVLLAACSWPGEPSPTPGVDELVTPVPSTPTPTLEGEIAVPFTTIAVTTFYVDPTPTFITPPEVDANAESGSGPLWLREYQIPRNPRLYMLAAPEDVEEAAQYLPPKTAAAIRAIDFNNDVVVVLLRGVGGYGNATFIERIGSRYGSLTAYVQFWMPVYGYAYPEVMTFPFHVIKIKRADLPVMAGSELPSLSIRYEAYEVTPTPSAELLRDKLLGIQ